jgi:glycerophosphoryl diester phosphodiesterase
VISLERRDGRPLRIGHRGAATLAPENTLASFRAALEVGVDLVEFDVVAAPSGGLVVAHSRADISDETPTFDEALRFFVDEAPGVGAHVDLKVSGRELDVVAAIRRHDLEERALVSGFFLGTARALHAQNAAIRAAITFPRGVFGISDDGRRAPIGRAGLRTLRRFTPFVVPLLLGRTRANAIALHYSLVTRASVQAAHARGAPVVAWTVDDPAALARVDEAGADAVVTNDPRIFTSTLQHT